MGVSLVYKTHNLFAGNLKKCATFLRIFFVRCESKIDVVPSQAYLLQKRRGVGPLCHPISSWICVDTIVPCLGLVDKEGADSVGVHHFLNDDHNIALLQWYRRKVTCVHTHIQ